MSLPFRLEIDLRLSAETIERAREAAQLPTATDQDYAIKCGSLTAHTAILTEELDRAHAYIMQATQTEDDRTAEADDSTGSDMTDTPTPHGTILRGNADLVPAQRGDGW